MTPGFWLRAMAVTIMNELENPMSTITEYVKVVATNGEVIELPKDMAGMRTGFAFVGNGFSEGVEHFDRYSDGDTVLECEANDPRAMTVADAYQMLYAAEREENVQMCEYEIIHEERLRYPQDIIDEARARISAREEDARRRAGGATHALKDAPFARFFAQHA